jgi:outer membrane protein assembly factor BamA
MFCYHGVNLRHHLQGVGIEWASTIGRLELNLATVVRHQEHDRISRGIQFGIRPPLF